MSDRFISKIQNSMLNKKKDLENEVSGQFDARSIYLQCSNYFRPN